MELKQPIETFVQIWQERQNAYFDKHYSNLNKPVFKVTYGKKYAKIIQDTAVSAFVDLETGDILKPASWAKPAKTARGNVLSPTYGEESLDSSNFIKYLR
jgi:hypothetical protein